MRSSNLIMVVLLVLLVLGAWEVRNAEALTASQCAEEKRLGVLACTPVVYGAYPSSLCCYRIRVSHVECVCPIITPKLTAGVDIRRLIRVIQGCGRVVPRHFKCGSITTP